MDGIRYAATLGVLVARERRTGSLKPVDGWFAEAFEENYAKLHRFLHRTSGDLALAEESVQEAFARLYRRGEPPDDPRAWLFTVGINLIRNAKKKTARRRSLMTRERSTHVLADPPPGPDAALRSSERRDLVRRALDTLPERDRQLLLLRAEGFRYRELAELVGVKSASVGTQLKRAKEAFRTAYEGAMDAT